MQTNTALPILVAFALLFVYFKSAPHKKVY